jgi:hypothetical protein
MRKLGIVLCGAVPVLGGCGGDDRRVTVSFSRNLFEPNLDECSGR